METLTDVADYDAGEAFENVPTPRSDAGNYDKDQVRLLSRPDKTKLRYLGQHTSINRKDTATIPRATPSWSSYLYRDGSTLFSQLGRSVSETLWNVPSLVFPTIVFVISSIGPLTGYIHKHFAGIVTRGVIVS
ncbi:unnamed protein product [Protopolystoma xenopodis]|uniref:Uncharacterized protein n=1 Tax=Protopolystoma xenopodis TaxID=117903 RepID=A0A3S5B2C6_9PLAT|nr:unnamed protein product [Protopolystoma xenopodis]